MPASGTIRGQESRESQDYNFAEALGNAVMGEKLWITPPAAGKWRRRNIDKGIGGPSGLQRGGRPPAYDPAKTREAVPPKLEKAPPSAQSESQWGGKALAKELNMSGA